MAAVEAMFTTWARSEARRAGRAARVMRAGPWRLTSSTRSQSSPSIDSNGAVTSVPALLTRTSRAPYRSTAAATAWAASSGRVTSSSTADASPPSPSIAATVPAAPSTATSAAITRIPEAASRMEVARPRPEPAPVTRTTLPTRSG
jgi:hypothetical protein